MTEEKIPLQNNENTVKPKLRIGSSPHIFAKEKKSTIMWNVVLALMPAFFTGIYFFGYKVILIALSAIISSVVADALFNYIRKKPVFKRTLDGPAVVTGLLLALTLPPTVPLWIPALGSVVAMAIAKHAFGGPGMTLFNPALVGRAFLVLSFPALMGNYIWPDGVTSASPLSMLKTQGYNSAIDFFGGNISAYNQMLIGNISGCIGEVSAIALIIGGLYLIIRKIVDWRIPFIYIGTVAIGAYLAGQDPLYHVLGGGLMIGAFFMATDYAGMPLTKMGRIYFALGLGILTILMRLFSSYPEGVNFSILIMNAATPLIERFTVSKPYGYKKAFTKLCNWKSYIHNKMQ